MPAPSLVRRGNRGSPLRLGTSIVYLSHQMGPGSQSRWPLGQTGLQSAAPRIQPATIVAATPCALCLSDWDTSGQREGSPGKALSLAASLPLSFPWADTSSPRLHTSSSPGPLVPSESSRTAQMSPLSEAPRNLYVSKPGLS